MTEEYLFSINGMKDGAIWDEGVITRSGRYFYLQWIGLGIKRRISKKCVDRLSKSEVRIKNENDCLRYL